MSANPLTKLAPLGQSVWLDLIRRKGLYGHRGWPPDDVLHEAGALDRVVATWRVVRPLVEWLDDHVGPSEQPRR